MGEGKAPTLRADDAATLAARGTSVGHTSTYSDIFNVRRERRRNMLGFKRVTIGQHERGLERVPILLAEQIGFLSPARALFR
jgi:hypothetical protein